MPDCGRWCRRPLLLSASIATPPAKLRPWPGTEPGCREEVHSLEEQQDELLDRFYSDV